MKRFTQTGNWLLIGLICLTGLLACNNNTLFRIQTDIPELALLADQYQALPGAPSIIIEYKAQLVSNFPLGNAPDLLVGHGLYNQPSLDNLANQKELFETDPVNIGEFYDFSFIKHHDEYRLSVLSWDLPAIITRVPETSQDFYEGIMLALDNLRDKGVQFNARKKGSLHALGFSPMQASEFLYMVAQCQGASLSSDYRGYPTWNPDGLQKSIANLNDWSTRFNGGTDQETAFISKFTYDPVYQLLHQGRLSFAYSRSSDFLRQPQTVSQGLSLHWPSWQDRLLILDNFVAAGIPRQASHKPEAIRFIKWLLREDTQTAAIAAILDSGQYSFGFLQGFSTRRLVNEKTIPFYFPLVRLRIPPDSALNFPPLQGIQWETYKKEVFEPWFRQHIIQGNLDTASLKSTSKQWLLHLGLDP